MTTNTNTNTNTWNLERFINLSNGKGEDYKKVKRLCKNDKEDILIETLYIFNSQLSKEDRYAYFHNYQQDWAVKYENQFGYFFSYEDLTFKNIADFSNRECNKYVLLNQKISKILIEYSQSMKLSGAELLGKFIKMSFDCDYISKYDLTYLYAKFRNWYCSGTTLINE